MNTLKTAIIAASSSILLALANTLLSSGHSFLFFGETEIPEELK